MPEREMTGNILARIVVTGRVQGVGYRYATYQAAKKLGLKGYVKNLPDQSVYIEAQGDRESVMALIAWSETGPGRAAVESVQHTIHPPEEYGSFKIL